MIFFVLLSSCLVVAVYQISFFVRRRRVVERSWEEILTSIEPVDIEALQDVASMFLTPAKNQLRYEPNVIWQMLGGLEGINRLRANAAALLDLAVYAERWNRDHGPCVSELIRRDAVNLNKAVNCIQLAVGLQFGNITAPFALMEAAAHYELIRRRLLGIYEDTHVALLPQLLERV